MQVNTIKLAELKGPNITDILKNMPITVLEKLDVTEEDAATVRTTISRLHEDGFEFSTKKTETGIMVWRTK